MGDPFKTYNDEVAKFLSAPRPAERTGPDEKV